MKKRTYKPKRITLLTLIFRAFLVVLVLSLVFAWGFWNYLMQSVTRQSEEQISDNLSKMQKNISGIEASSDSEYLMQEISCSMAISQDYDIIIEEPFYIDPNKSMVQIIPQYSPGCNAVAALIDQNDNIVASNREILLTYIRFALDDDWAFYVCDKEALQMPQVDQLYADYKELAQTEDMIHYVEMQVTSAYVNKEKHIFIPHEGSMVLRSLSDNYEVLIENSQQRETAVKEINITIDDNAYELVELHQGLDSEFPRNIMFYFFGETKETFDLFKDDFVFQSEHSYTNSSSVILEDGRKVFSRNVPVYINKQPYFLTLRFVVNYHDPQLMKLYWKWTILFTVVMTVIAFLWCWRQNVVNKAKYAFEDYQRDLTDHLAHDIKTPLMAISGYAENIIKGNLSDEEQQRYLSSILDNVAFTDSLISRTLFLNHIGEKNAPKLETIQIESLVEDMMQKYDLLLDEKQITYSISGSAAINADHASLETIIENLVSNAVKYTPENGSVNVTLDKKHLLITNTVTERINTKDLKRPFVRGDEARSNVKGNGLGLSIAERAAQINGFTLSLSCTDTIFKAELKF